MTRVAMLTSPQINLSGQPLPPPRLQLVSSATPVRRLNVWPFTVPAGFDNAAVAGHNGSAKPSASSSFVS